MSEINLDQIDFTNSEKRKPGIKAALEAFLTNKVSIDEQYKVPIFTLVRRHLGSVADAEAILGYSCETQQANNAQCNITRSDKGLAHWTTSNIRIALNECLGIDTLKYNVLTGIIEIKGAHKFGYFKFDSTFVDWVMLELVEKHNFSSMGKNDCRKFLVKIAKENQYHPIKNYLDPLKWDGANRVDSWLVRLAGVEDSTYTRAVSSLLLKAMVKRIYEPGAMFQELVVLISEKQGLEKSSALEALCVHKDWYLGAFDPGWSMKEIIEQTQDKWLVEYAELDKIGKRDASTVKSVLSRASDRGREAYAEKACDCPRQWVVVATANESRFLVDTTGNRRFWPLTLTHKFDVVGLKSELDQLWAEAKYRAINLNESLRLDPSLYEEAAIVQQMHEVENSQYELLADIIGNKTGSIQKKDIRIILDIPVASQIGKHETSQAMKALGFKSSQRKHNGIVKEAWVKEMPNTYDGWLVPYKGQNDRCWSLQKEITGNQHETTEHHNNANNFRTKSGQFYDLNFDWGPSLDYTN